MAAFILTDAEVVASTSRTSPRQNKRKNYENMQSPNKKRKRKYAKRWCFTLNNYTVDEYEKLQCIGENQCTYMILGKEHGEDRSTPHIQGYCIFKQRKDFTVVKKMIPRAHLEVARGSSSDNKKYCSKDGDYWENGEFSETAEKQSCLSEAVSSVLSGENAENMLETYGGAYVVQHKNIHQVASSILAQKHQNTLTFENATLRNWQQHIFDILQKQLDENDDRTVLWVVDAIGNCGKSWFAKYLFSTLGSSRVFITHNCSTRDITYAYNYQDICIFDLGRSSGVNYEVLEMFKDGVIFSSKYESGLKVRSTCAVLVLSNFLPDRSQLSQDRWLIYELTQLAGVITYRRVNTTGASAD